MSAVLVGSRKDEARAFVIMNAAAALFLGGAAADLREGAKMAADSIDTWRRGAQIGIADRGDEWTYF